jgi:hypothetical protein
MDLPRNFTFTFAPGRYLPNRSTGRFVTIRAWGKRANYRLLEAKASMEDGELI